jgi:hypothetical protein
MLKSKRIGLILTEEEKWLVVQLARIEGGLSQSSLVRRLIHKAAEQHGLSNLSEDTPEPKLTADTVSLVYEFVKPLEEKGITNV